MRRHVMASLCAASAFLAAAGMASAGGFVSPVLDQPVAAPVTPAPAADWAGAYGGIALGYSFGGDDEVGLDAFEDGALVGRETGLTNLELSGVTADVHAGYRWQRGNWVFGPELSIESGSVDDVSDLTFDGEAGRIESSVDYLASLTLKTGYLVSPATLVYGSAGLAYGKFSYDLTGLDVSGTEDYSANGYVLGLGVERKIGGNMSVFAEYQYRDYGRTDVTFTDGADSLVTVGTPTHQNVKFGVNFSF